MRNHLVSHRLSVLSLLLACSTHVVFYIWVCILRRYFSCSSCPLLSLFFKMFGVFAVRVEMDLRRGVDG